MIFHETGLVVLYFFTWAEIEKQVATAKPDAIGQWCQFLTGQLQLEPVPGQRQMWRHPWHPISLDVQRDLTNVMVRLVLRATTQDPSPHWGHLYDCIYSAHETIFRQMLAGFSGCSLIYSGMMMDEHLPADVATVLAAIPVQESLPYPRHLNVRSGQLWQVQETIPGGRSENIYGLLLQPTHEEAITYQLLYHPAFWQAEAIYHELTQAWSYWKRTQQPIGAQAIQQLEKGLAALLEPHCQSTLLDQQRGELNHCLRVVQQHESTVYQLHEQIAAASQQYRILIKTFTTAKSGNLLNSLQNNLKESRKQIVINKKKHPSRR